MGLRYLSAGESHGRALTAILEGIPSGLGLKAEEIDMDLARRQRGYGRGKRMNIEKDRVKIVSMSMRKAGGRRAPAGGSSLGRPTRR